ncbi:MAG: hypothetical protein ACRDJ3_01065 [Solirubrobacteraceae bacterium]
MSVLACAHSAKSTTSVSGTASVSTTTVTPPGGYLKRDGDGSYDDKGGNPYYAHHRDDDEIFLATYGREADRVDKRTITAMVKRYYAAAVAGEGAKACALLLPSLVKATVEVHGQVVNGSAAYDSACAPIMTSMFKRQHQELLADEVATMRVLDVHVKRNMGVVVLGFRRVPERVILIAREGTNWMIDGLLDGEMT